MFSRLDNIVLRSLLHTYLLLPSCPNSDSIGSCIDHDGHPRASVSAPALGVAGHSPVGSLRRMNAYYRRSLVLQG